MFKPGTRIYDTLTNHAGTTVTAEYLPDNGGIYLVVTYVSDKTGKRCTVKANRLVTEASVK